MKPPRRLVTLFAWLGLVLAGISALGYGLRNSAIAVVVDVPVLGLAAGFAGIVLGAFAFFHLPPTRRTRRIVAGLAVAGALVMILLLIPFRFTSHTTEEVRFSNGEVELAGTVYTPRGEGPHPGGVLVHGSGPETREEYDLYARHLARQGIAGFAYDKRGTGGSGGALYESDYGDYAGDVTAAVAALQARPEIDPRAIGLIGFSEAEWVAPQAAVRSDAVAFVAVVGASGLRPSEQVSREIELRLREKGYGDIDVQHALRLNEQLLAYQRTGEGADELEAALSRARAEPWFDAAEDFPDEVYPADAYAWWRTVMDFDSDAAWREVRVPVLLIKGGRDDRSSPGPMRKRIAAALADGGNEELTVRVFEDADHMLLTWPLGEGIPPPMFANGYLETLVEWGKEQVRTEGESRASSSSARTQLCQVVSVKVGEGGLRPALSS